MWSAHQISTPIFSYQLIHVPSVLFLVKGLLDYTVLVRDFGPVFGNPALVVVTGTHAQLFTLSRACCIPENSVALRIPHVLMHLPSGQRSCQPDALVISQTLSVCSLQLKR